MFLKKLLCCLLCSLPAMAWGEEPEALAVQIKKAIKPYRAVVGVAAIINGRDTVTVNNDERYPMLSVYKFHQALSVGHYLQAKGLTLNDSVYISLQQLHQDTWSPLRDAHPEGGLAKSIAELLRYTLQMSDNNACDILFDFVGGPHYTDSIVREMGGRDFAVVSTEKQMHDNPEDCYRNWSTPLDAVCLLERFETEEMLSENIQSYIRHLMTTCETGTDRMVLPLVGCSAKVGHKTGTSGLNARKLWSGTNDIGFVRLPSGKRYVLAVFVKDSAEAPQVNAQIIAEVSRIVYEFVAEE